MCETFVLQDSSCGLVNQLQQQISFHNAQSSSSKKRTILFQIVIVLVPAEKQRPFLQLQVVDEFSVVLIQIVHGYLQNQTWLRTSYE